MKIIYGTENQGKIEAIKARMETLPVEVEGLPAGCDIDIDECGETPHENARIKAEAYYSCLNRPVFSFDSGLYFDEVQDHEQPKTHVRRVDGHYMNDDEMIEYYSSLAKKYGGRLTARYVNAACLVFSETCQYVSEGDFFSSEPFYIVDKAHAQVDVGFPLNRLSVEIESGLYYNDIDRTKYKPRKGKENLYRTFFENALAYYSKNKG